jgi:hypothetical protein
MPIATVNRITLSDRTTGPFNETCRMRCDGHQSPTVREILRRHTARHGAVRSVAMSSERRERLRAKMRPASGFMTSFPRVNSRKLLIGRTRLHSGSRKMKRNYEQCGDRRLWHANGTAGNCVELRQAMCRQFQQSLSPAVRRILRTRFSLVLLLSLTK